MNYITIRWNRSCHWVIVRIFGPCPVLVCYSSQTGFVTGLLFQNSGLFSKTELIEVWSKLKKVIIIHNSLELSCARLCANLNFSGFDSHFALCKKSD